jgi:hypothetical protein
MITPITLGADTVSVVSIPSQPGYSSVEFSFSDAVAVVSSPFTGQAQAQQWRGADVLSATVTLPPLTQTQADAWISFLMECRGMANAFQIGDPMKTSPRGTPLGSAVVDGSFPMVAGGQVLYTKNWTANKTGLLLPGDYVQVGYRLYRNLDTVNSDTSGNALINIWPSLREVPVDNEPIVLNNTLGLFRLATNKRTWSADFTKLTLLSFQVTEYR